MRDYPVTMGHEEPLIKSDGHVWCLSICLSVFVCVVCLCVLRVCVCVLCVYTNRQFSCMDDSVGA